MGGLTNRIRTILGYRAWLRQEQLDATLTVEWGDLRTVAGGRWSDILEPLAGVEFVDACDWPVPHDGSLSIVNGVAAHACGPRHLGWDIQFEHLNEIKLLPSLVSKLREGRFNAIHARRGDLIEMNASGGHPTTSDQQFIDWVIPRKELPLFIAADSTSSYSSLCVPLAKAGVGLIPPYAEIGDTAQGDARNTSLAHAALDFFTCIRAVDFMGTRGSSYTEMIGKFRERGIRQ